MLLFILVCGSFDCQRDALQCRLLLREKGPRPLQHSTAIHFNLLALGYVADLNKYHCPPYVADASLLLALKILTTVIIRGLLMLFVHVGSTDVTVPSVCSTLCSQAEVASR